MRATLVLNELITNASALGIFMLLVLFSLYVSEVVFGGLMFLASPLSRSFFSEIKPLYLYILLPH